MKKSFLTIKNLGNDTIKIEDLIIESNEEVTLELDKLSTTLWKNIISLVNKRILEYSIKKEEVEDKIEEPIVEEVEEKPKTKRKTRKKKEE